MNILFVVPARSGSKGIKDKNIKLLGDKPLMGYVLSTLREVCERRSQGYVLLDTDSLKYAELGQNYGSKTPYLRPAHLADDKSKIKDVLKYSMDYFEEAGRVFDLVALIQPTSPFINADDVERALEMFTKDGVDSVISVAEAPIPPVWCNTLDEDRSMASFLSAEVKTMNRQELPTYYAVNGAIRVARWNVFKESGYDWYMSGAKALILTETKAIDIDTMDDFRYAEFLVSQNAKQH